MSSGTAAVIAAAAAQKKRRRLRAEEEMATYTVKDLEEDWEFKTVRANTRAFANPATLRQVVEEEARAGWVLLEKFDDSRLRFKRRRGAGPQVPADSSAIDPYRTHYGISPTQYSVVILAAALLITGFCVFGAMILGLTLSGL